MAASESAQGKRSPFPATFFVANFMEIFERLAWYGFFGIAAVYMTSPVEQGGLGFTPIQKGAMIGIIPFLLYLFPVITGALADRYGYRRMFIISYIMMCPAYYLLGKVTGFWSFFIVFLALAFGAAVFKPVVTGTVGRTTDDTNRGLGFGIFYTIVNLGTFFGPIVAGYVRAISWDLVFVMSAIWIAINFIPAIFFFKEPTDESTSSHKRTLKQVLLDAQDVLGNGRFALVVIPMLVLMMLGGGGWLDWTNVLIGMGILLAANIVWNMLASTAVNAPWYLQKTKIGNWPFVTYLIIMGGFWTMYYQLWVTMPEYIRDFVDTGDLVAVFDFTIFGASMANFLASVNIEQLSAEITRLMGEYGGAVNSGNANELLMKLVHYKVRVPEAEIITVFQSLGQATNPQLVAEMAQRWADQYRQINPEFIINISAGAILLFQIIVSLYAERFKAMAVLIFGCILSAISWFFVGFSHSVIFGGTYLAVFILLFAFGEMITSPKSQEYVASIAPKGKTALFMGYYFVCIALGNLFGGILSGWGYQVFALDMNNPELMWAFYGAIAAITGLALWIFDRKVVHHLDAQREEDRGVGDVAESEPVTAKVQLEVEEA